MLRRIASPVNPAILLALTLGLLPIGCANDATITRDTDATTAVERSTPTAPRASADGTPGAIDVGDPIMPGAGNGGYDVLAYGLDISVSVDRTSIEGMTTIRARATQDLAAFNLDLSGLEVHEVTIDGTVATSSRADDELTITPDAPIAEGTEFTTVVQYGGTPQPVEDPSAPGTIGWLSAPSGTFVASEPTGAKGFFPCNDHPSDKATFVIAVTAPSDDTVVANGPLQHEEEHLPDRTTTWTFAPRDQMATYLVQIAVGDYDLLESTGPHGLPIRHAVVRSVTDPEREVLGDTAAQIEFFEPLFGPYPFDNYGLLVADSLPEFALETQTLTLLPASWLTSDSRAGTSTVMAHELAHQWFGDDVTPARWSDIWLNEGFATYGEWLWADHQGYEPLEGAVAATMSSAGRWREGFGPVVEPTPQLLFSPNEYGGAGIVLHALRKTVGDDAFFTILRTWASERAGTSATTEDFEAVAEKVSGQDLGAFFDAWLRSSTLPEMPG